MTEHVTTAAPSADSVSVLGVQIHPMTNPQLIDTVEAVVATKRFGIVANHNMHSAYCVRSDQRMADFYRMADVAHVDGMGLVAAARMAGHPLTKEHRNTYIDFVWQLLDRAQAQRWRVYLIGATPESLIDALKAIGQELPNLDVGGHDGYFDATADSADSRRVVEDLQSFQPDLVLVGMGMPRQERWIADHATLLPAACYMNSGACTDLLSGRLITPPRWVGRAGLEWVVRLVREPRRLWRRYLVEPWVLAPALAADVWRNRIRRRR